MIQSMTGFGKATGDFNGKNITVELRSLNSKQFDLNLRIPGLYKEKELDLRSNLSRSLSRGKVELSIYVESGDGSSSHTLNHDLAQNYHRELSSLASSLNEQPGNFMEMILRMPDVLKSVRPELEEGEWKEVQLLVSSALDRLQNFRSTEGSTLEEVFRTHIAAILRLLTEIEPFETARIATIRERIQKNLEEAVADQNLDRNRFEQELIFYLEKLDVTEEKVRLKTHCDYFLEILDHNDPQGKKLGFIAQEIGREINTLGSKANQADMQKLVIQMKDELEKIKEQILNVL